MAKSSRNLMLFPARKVSRFFPAMKRKFLMAFFLFAAVLLCSCAGQGANSYRPVPNYADDVIPEKSIFIGDITQTRGGAGYAHLPGWLFAFINGGIEEVEGMDFYRDKYCFIGTNESGNFGALNKWAENYSVAQDFPRLAAVRIEKRLISAAALYPDDEYGSFYEIMVKKAFDAEYAGAFLEDTFWIKKKGNQSDSSGEAYEFFVFISIDRITMRNILENMMTEKLALVTPTRAQNTAIKRLQQDFFAGF